VICQKKTADVDYVAWRHILPDGGTEYLSRTVVEAASAEAMHAFYNHTRCGSSGTGCWRMPPPSRCVPVCVCTAAVELILRRYDTIEPLRVSALPETAETETATKF
jgi:hypothetical protein